MNIMPKLRQWMYWLQHHGTEAMSLEYCDDGKMKLVWECLYCGKKHEIIIDGCCFPDGERLVATALGTTLHEHEYLERKEKDKPNEHNIEAEANTTWPADTTKPPKHSEK